MQRKPGAAVNDFKESLDTSKDPRTLAWSHIYLGRLYDIMPQPTARKPSLSIRPPSPSATASPTPRLPPKTAQKTLHPATKHETSARPDDDTPLDPSGKAEKDAYRSRHRPATDPTRHQQVTFVSPDSAVLLR